MSEGYRTDRSKVEGLGSSHHGTGSWIRERVTSILLIPLAVWAVWAAWTLIGGGYGGAIAWLQSPVNAVLLIVVLMVSIYHMQLGMRVVVEDYLHKPLGKGFFLLANFIICLLLAAVAVFSVLKIALGPAIGV